MICNDCIHSIVRVINNLADETFVVCSLDGKLMTPSLVKCSRYSCFLEKPVTEPVEEVKAKQAVTDEFVCSVCGKTVSSRIALVGHMRTHNRK